MTVNPKQDLAAIERCQKLLERIPQMAWLMTDLDSEGSIGCGKIIAANRRWLYIVEPAPNQGSVGAFSEIVHEDDRTRFLLAWGQASKSQEPLVIKLRLRSVANVGEWFTVELEPDRDACGRIIWIGTAIPLGGEVVIPGKQQSAQFLEALLSHASDAIVACDAHGHLVLFNRMAQQFHGLPPEPIDPEDWSSYYDLYDADGIRTLSKSEIPLFRALQGESVVSQEMMIKSKQGGGSRSLLANGAPIYSLEGEKLGAVALMRDITAYKQAETERVRAQLYSERLSLAMRTAKAAAWHWDLNLQKIFWTPEFEVLFDYEPGSTQQTYHEWRDRVHPDDCDAAEARLQDTLARKLPESRSEYRIIWRDGQIRWIDAVGELHHDDQGNLLWFSGLVFDITDRKRVEEELRRNEEFTRRILESHQDCLKVVDLEGHILYMNNAGQALMEIDDFATIDRVQWSTFWQEPEAELGRAVFARAKAGEMGKFDGYCPTTKGTPKWWEVVVTPILNAARQPEQILMVARDITARKQAEIALQKSEELFRHTFENSPIGYCHVGLDGSWLRVNYKVCEMIGYSAKELLATTFQAITEPDDLDEDMALVAQLLNDELNEYTLEKRYIHKQGHHVWVSLSVSLVRSSALDRSFGTPLYFLSAIQDISDRKKLEFVNQQQTANLKSLNLSLILAQDRLRERNIELDRFVYMAAHDLKAPLRAISNLSTWIEEDFGTQTLEENQQQLQLMRQRVNRMTALVDGLLRYSQIGRKALELETVDVSELVCETIDLLAPPEQFEIKNTSPLPVLTTKRILLSQIFANLLSNAIKHHDRPDGHIEISATDYGDRYQFSVSDDGPGIPQGEACDRIFEIFQTLRSSDSTENTGIGLALVKKIVEGEGGQIWVDHTQPKGACFCFTWLKIDNSAVAIESPVWTNG